MNRAVMARRARSNPAIGATSSTGHRGTVSTNPALRVQTPVDGTGRIVKSRAMKMTGAQRNSEGRRSEWSASPQFFTDPKWSQTVTSQR